MPDDKRQVCPASSLPTENAEGPGSWTDCTTKLTTHKQQQQQQQQKTKRSATLWVNQHGD